MSDSSHKCELEDDEFARQLQEFSQARQFQAGTVQLVITLPLLFYLGWITHHLLEQFLAAQPTLFLKAFRTLLLPWGIVFGLSLLSAVVLITLKKQPELTKLLHRVLGLLALVAGFVTYFWRA